MQRLFDQQPIIACSTGRRENSALAVLRLSGFKNILDLDSFFSISLSTIESRKAYLSDLIDGETILDNVLLTYFKGPYSYNGENILELSVHGNQINVERILNLFTSKASFRLAAPGEFTYRALTNGKLSLSQVEGLDLLLNANSALMLDQGLETLHGDLFQQYKALHKSYIKLKASVELAIDFSEDVGEETALSQRKEALNDFSHLIGNLHQRIQGDNSSLVSPDVVLVGQTNAGKSSLFNTLLRTNRSIVSDQAGTTRDFVSENIFIDGTNFRLVDTAGLRETSDEIEKEGMLRGKSLIQKAFFKILVVNPFETRIENFHDLDVEFDLIIYTHQDIDGFEDQKKSLKLPFKARAEIYMNLGPMGADLGGSIGPKSKSGPIGPVLELISSKFNELSSNNPILIDRHRDSIKNIYEELSNFQVVSDNIDDMAILSSELGLLGTEIEQLIGIVSPDQVLNSIFSNFCIGK